jgi:hypothetical protein
VCTHPSKLFPALSPTCPNSPSLPSSSKDQACSWPLLSRLDAAPESNAFCQALRLIVFSLSTGHFSCEPSLGSLPFLEEKKKLLICILAQSVHYLVTMAALLLAEKYEVLWVNF